MNERIQNWFDHLTRKYYESGYGGSEITFTLLDGKKYYKIVYTQKWESNGQYRHQVVHAFVDKTTGDVYKPASFRSPAKIARFNILNDASYNTMINNCDWAGSYLYIR